MKRFDALDSLRGVAAVMVALFHVFPFWAGYLMLDFFFVLSGFILSHSYLYREKAVGPIEFMGHRLARMYPLHVYTLITFALAFYFTQNQLPVYKDGLVYTLFQQLTLTQNVGLHSKGVPWNGPAWSISVEIWLNLLFILYVSQKTRSSTLFFIAVFCLFAIYNNTGGQLNIGTENFYKIINSGLLRGGLSFLVGILAYRFYRHYQHDKRFISYATLLEVLSIGFVVFIILWRTKLKSNMDMLSPLAFFIVVVVFAFNRGLISRGLLHIKYLGDISYSVFLNHISVIYVCSYFKDRYDIALSIYLPILAILLFVYSHFTYKYIEDPARKRFRDTLPRLLAVHR